MKYLLLVPCLLFSDVYIDNHPTINHIYNYSPYEFYQMQQDLSDLHDYTFDFSAGSIAVATIDFSSTQEGKYSLGFGMGTSTDFDNLYSTAGAVGLKYGISDTSAIISKAWIGSNGTGALGVGYSFDF